MVSMKKVIVFGSTGAIGTSLVEFLAQEHDLWTIQAVSRNPQSPSRLAEMKRRQPRRFANVEIVQGDPFDKDQVIDSCKSCDMIYCCIGFHKYERAYWAKHWPIVIDNLLAATGSKKKLIFCDNLYAYGPGHVSLNNRQGMVKPSTKGKPAVRAMLRKTIQKHMDKYPGTVTVVGGADFFGPHVTANSFLGDTMTAKIVRGESALALGSRRVVHDFCYAPDFARALAVASVSTKAYDRFWICPHAIHNKTMTEIAQDIAQIAADEADASKKATTGSVQVTVLPKCMLYLLSPFMGIMGEMIEMMPFWCQDYIIDDSAFIREFGLKPTPYRTALRELVRFYQQQQQQA